MVDVTTSTENQTHSKTESDDQYTTQPPEEMLTTGEHTLYEIRPLLWPYLARPSLWIIIGIVIAVYSQRIPLDFLRDIDEFISLALITSVIKWLGIGLLCVGILGVLIRCLRWRFTAYTVTNLRILRRTGILAKSYVDCSLSKVQTLYLEIPAIGRILNYGTIRVATAGTNTSEIHWERVRNPKNAHRVLSETIEQYRRQ